MGEENQEKQENQEGKVTLDKKDRFNWTKLYPKIAEKLEKYGDEQKELIEFLTKENNIGIPEGTANTIEKFGIDPFSFFALFNRNINNRRGVIKVFCGFLNVNIDKSEIDNINFHGIPLVDSRNILFYSKEEKDNDPRETIKALWRVFIKSFEFERDPALDIDKFSDLFNEALSCKQVSNMFATALFWIHPDKFIPFDTNTRTLINNFILTEEEANDNCSQLEGDSESFRDKKDKLKELKDLTWVGYRELCKKVNEKIGKVKNGENEENKEIMKELEIDDNNRYASFSHKARELSFLDELFTNKNIILYGPPGTGKTYQTLQAIKLMTKNNSNYFKSYQFHPNYTYDDFIDGIKPVGFENGQIQLELCNGHFKDFCIKVHKANKKRLYDNDSLISQDEKCEARNGNETENNEDEQKK